MKRMLAIETSAEACSAALAVDGDVRERFEHAPLRHAELILPMISGLLAEAGLRAGDLDEAEERFWGVLIERPYDEEALAGLALLAEEIDRQDFDGNGAAEDGVLRLPHHAHPALADLLDEPVVRQHLPRLQ